MRGRRKWFGFHLSRHFPRWVEVKLSILLSFYPSPKTCTLHRQMVVPHTASCYVKLSVLQIDPQYSLSTGIPDAKTGSILRLLGSCRFLVKRFKLSGKSIMESLGYFPIIISIDCKGNMDIAILICTVESWVCVVIYLGPYCRACPLSSLSWKAA